MDARLALVSVHLVALCVGPAGVWGRARALRDARRDPDDRGAPRRALAGERWWRVALLAWLVSGCWGLAAGTEAAASWYARSHLFQVKIGLFLLVLALELWPMLTVRRIRASRGAPGGRDARRLERISYVQCVLALVMVLAAAGMSRGGVTAVATTVAVPPPRPVPASRAVLPASAVPIAPTGTETVTDADVALLVHEIRMPLERVDPASLHSNFDERRGGGTRQHKALDLMAPRRTPIHSAASGRVLRLFTSVAGGLMVYAADSSERFILMYAHLDGYAPGLRDGAPLARGQLLGYVGSTGNAQANAPHLHFAIARSGDVRHWSRGRAIDPLPVLRAQATVADAH